MPSGSFRQANILCPFYKWDDGKKKIHCEGVTEDSYLSQTYSRKADFELQVDVFCSQHYAKCELYSMLLAKYDDEAVSEPRDAAPIKADAVFPGYTGAKRYYVNYPGLASILVAAPDTSSALAAAATHWAKRWQSYEFYAFASVDVCRTKTKTKK